VYWCGGCSARKGRAGMRTKCLLPINCGSSIRKERTGMRAQCLLPTRTKNEATRTKAGKDGKSNKNKRKPKEGPGIITYIRRKRRTGKEKRGICGYCAQCGNRKEEETGKKGGGIRAGKRRAGGELKKRKKPQQKGGGVWGCVWDLYFFL